MSPDIDTIAAVIRELLIGSQCHCCGTPNELVGVWVSNGSDELIISIRCGLGLQRRARLSHREFMEREWYAVADRVRELAPPMSQADAWRLMEESVSL